MFFTFFLRAHAQPSSPRPGRASGVGMRLTVRTLRRGWSASVDVPDGCTVGELRRVAARAADISPWSRAKIVLRGASLVDDAAVAPVRPDDTLLVASAPIPPTAQIPPSTSPSSGRGAPPAFSSRRRRAGGDHDDVSDDSDDDTPEARAAPARVALRRAGVPDLLARLLVAVSWRAWVGALLWLALCRLSHAFDLGPVFVVCSGFVAIRLNLGDRKPGEASAYSIFNGFRELPGAFNAAAVDEHVRRGGR